MILGLDISTSITGFTIIDDSGNIIDNAAWDFKNAKKFPTMMTKAKFVKEQLTKIHKDHKIEKIYIEKSLQSFRSGFSSAKTLSTLSSFNGILSWICFEVFGVEPDYLAATSARRSCGIVIPKGVKAKEIVIQHLIDNEPAFKVEWTKTGKPKPYCYDKADSIIIAKAGWLCEQKSKSLKKS
jgi:Holliday junction resolvasome RuvABC endonuclease subunit